ncbi:mitochondrial pyruvate dehydrogenase protein x component-like protein [Xylariaceae sp. FL0804]|nr:mitochondrial pyruvate dehydrogenase protein x component-like protein [Xylariaceae sp. FL0804]
MASLASAARLSARVVSRRVHRDVATRGFRTSAAALAAQNFTMPALSPTMTEGNISSWKVKEGDSFAAGDVLLEIETDKATMDVEAQDDGVVMKIMQGDGSKGIQVGSRIGVIAETGDDISQLQIPADEQPAAQKEASGKAEPAKEEKPAQGASESAAASGAQKPQKSGQKAPPQKYPLYPSVQHLLREHGLDESAVGEMTPTGPSGRLLKGDVLAYMGSVSSGRPAEIMQRFQHNSHLDLSNIKVAAVEASQKTAEKAPAAAPPVPEELLVSLPVSLNAVIGLQKRIERKLGTFMPLSTFISRAAELANDELPLPSGRKPTADELFNQVLGLHKAGPRGSQGYYMPQIAALPQSGFTGVTPKPKSKVDIIDFLASSSSKKPTRTIPKPTLQTSVSAGDNVFSLLVPKPEQKRAKVFLQRMKVALEVEPGRLVL